MHLNPRSGTHVTLGVLTALSASCCLGSRAWAAPDYHSINATMADRTITLTGHDLTIDQVVQVARYGAKVQWSHEARQREMDQYELLLEAPVEGVSVYWYTRAPGAGRETVLFEGDPLSPKNKAFLEESQLRIFRGGARSGEGPEVADEDVVRAMMVVRANAMVYDGPSPQLAQMLIDLLNRQVTPVVRTLGSLGEADLAQLSNVEATMVGTGEAYFRGARMPAAQALAAAGLKPIQPFAADNNVLTSSDAFGTGQAALLVADAKQALDWADLIYAIDLNGMNSSITPITTPAQSYRPFKWLNWDAARVLDMIKGGYLFDDDKTRIIQDPESLRGSYVREGAAWEVWSRLRDTVVMWLNTPDHSPAVRVGMSPQDSWELSTPQMMKYYVKGGPNSHGHHGYIISNSNFDPYPLGNDIEAFTIALVNMDVAVTQRIDRFTNPFFTVVRAQDVLPDQGGGNGGGNGGGYMPVSLYQQILSLLNPLPPSGNAIIATVEDLQGQSPIKAARARQAVEDTMLLLGQDLLTGCRWLDVRKAQDPTRTFGAAPMAVLNAFRKSQQAPEAAEEPVGMVAADFLRANPIANFYSGGPTMPAGEARVSAQ